MRFTGYPRAEELLYPATEDRRLDLTVGKTLARTRTLDHLPSHGPCHHAGGITQFAAAGSFGLIQRLEVYGQEDLEAIVERAAGLLGLQLSPQGCTEIARRCRACRGLPIACCGGCAIGQRAGGGLR